MARGPMSGFNELASCSNSVQKIIGRSHIFVSASQPSMHFLFTICVVFGANAIAMLGSGREG